MIRICRLLVTVLASFLAASSAPAAAQNASGRPDREILVMVKHPADHYRATGAYGGSYGDELGRSARERLARQIARQYRLTLVDNWAMPMIGVDCFVMMVEDARSTHTAADEVSRNPNVEWAEPVQLYATQAAPPASHNDPLYPAEPAASQWHLAALHQMASGRGTRVAVIDSGIDAAHPDLAGQVMVNRNFVAGQPLVAEQHGTAVAGIIAAKADNRIGIAGIAPRARLLGLRACWQGRGSTSCDTLSLAKALYYAVDSRPDVINLSLSGPNARLLREILSIAYARGITVVAAFDPKQPGGGFPASVAGVIAVSDAPAPGADREVYVAPGRDVPTTQPGGRWFLVNGSSFAAAHVSGLIALLRERRPSAPLMLVSQRRGGSIDACATLIKVAGACDCGCRSAVLRAGLH